MSIYSTINPSRARAQREILNRVMSASDEDLEQVLFSITKGSQLDPLYYNNFRVGYFGGYLGDEDEEAAE